MRPKPTLEQVVLEGQRRLNPALTDPNWLILRSRRKIFREGLKNLPQPAFSVLDVGGRVQPYRALLSESAVRYVAVDLIVTPLVNVAAAGEALPFRDAQFDFVICTQVLEYFPDPRQATSEIRRVLKKGGIAFLSAPAIFLRDSDHDYWRFLPRGLRHLLKDFEHVDVIPEGGSVSGLFRTVNVFLISMARPQLLARLLQWTVVPALNLSGYVIERLCPNNDLFTANFSVWARK